MRILRLLLLPFAGVVELLMLGACAIFAHINDKAAYALIRVAKKLPNLDWYWGK